MILQLLTSMNGDTNIYNKNLLISTRVILVVRF